jgi:hypothetical protein
MKGEVEGLRHDTVKLVRGVIINEEEKSLGTSFSIFTNLLFSSPSSSSLRIAVPYCVSAIFMHLEMPHCIVN